MKRCYACGQELPEDAFGRNRAKPNGLACECRKCKRKNDAASYARNRDVRIVKMRVYRQGHIEEIRAKEREYSRSRRGREINNATHRRNYGKHRADKAAYAKRHAKEHPDRYTARYRLDNAIKLGHITPPEACQNCGIVGPVHGHHPDYSKPFDVEWLCRGCHGLKHRKEAGRYA
jgi:hypothetical protein